MTRPRQRLVALAVAVAVALALIPVSAAHRGGKADPVATVSVRQSGPLQALLDVSLRDADGGEPVRGAEVEGFGLMTRPHTMYTYFDALPEVAPGRYRALVRLPMTARWTLHLTVGGRGVLRREVRAPVAIERTAAARATPPQASQPPVVVGSVRYVITRREVRDIAVLWVHGAAATAWIVGLALLLLAASAGSGVFAAEARRRIGRWYRRQGSALLWLAAALVVATGIYNTLRVTPFEIVWRPGDLGDLEQIPYGQLYEAILLTKLLLFGLMLATGLAVARRARRTWDDDGARDRSPRTLVLHRIGASGAVFLLSAPLIVAAAVALRYVHILSHAAAGGG